MEPNNNQKVESGTYKFWLFIKKHGLSIVMGIAIITMLVNPDAKSWVLRQLMFTGLFNANIEQKDAETTSTENLYFEYVDEEGMVYNTKSLRGKVVFINFWASWCGPCRAEFPSIQTLYSKFQNNPDVQFLIINPDSDDLAKAKAYLAKENFTMPFLQSHSFIPDEIYTGSLPTTVVLDKNGAIRFKHEGFANYASEKFIKQIEDLVAE